MSYWGAGADENDFAFDSVGASIYLIKKRLFDDIASGSKDDGKFYPEQSIIAHLICLRLIGEQFPQNLSVSFGQRDFDAAKAAFYQWYDAARIPKKHKADILAGAEAEFALFEQHILNGEHPG